MARPEPFRAMLEQAFAAEGKCPPPSLASTKTPTNPSTSPSTSPSKRTPTRTSIPASLASTPPPKNARAEAADPRALDRRLDQILLAGGVTPARGLRVPAVVREVPLRLEPPAPFAAPRPRSLSVVERSSDRATDSLIDELDEMDEREGRDGLNQVEDRDATARLHRSATVDAALQDALADAEATREVPAQRAIPHAPIRTDDVSIPRLVLPALVREPTTAPPPVLVAAPPAAVEPAKKALPRPPPLPPKPAALQPVATVAPPPVLTAPPPRIVQFLGDESTLPGLSPSSSLSSSSSSSSSSGRVLNQSDLYRLQLEFEETPARPLPAHASLKPLPLAGSALGEAFERARGSGSEAPALVDADPLEHELNAELEALGALGLGGLESTDLNRLDELEGIEDLDALARALGLKSVTDISLPSGALSSGAGAPVLADDEPAPDGSEPRRELRPSEVTAIRRAAILAALGDGKESVFTSNEGRTITATRPALQARSAAVPVIVRIPSRPKVSAEAREQARKLYLSALEELGKGDKIGAVGHLKLAIHYDDSHPLYRDLLAQLEKGSRSDEAPLPEARPGDDRVGPALMVMKPSGRLSAPREEWQSERRR